MMLLSAGHKNTAQDHPHPTFSPDEQKYKSSQQCYPKIINQ